MRELTNKYDNAHGSSEPVIAKTNEPEPEAKPKEEKKGKTVLEWVMEFIKDTWYKYVDFVAGLTSRFNFNDTRTRIIAAALGVFVLIMAVILAVMYIIKPIGKTLRGMRRENEKVKKHLESEFENITRNMLQKTGLKPIGKAPMPGAPAEIPEPAPGASRMARVLQKIADTNRKLKESKVILETKDLSSGTRNILADSKGMLPPRVTRKYVEAMRSMNPDYMLKLETKMSSPPMVIEPPKLTIVSNDRVMLNELSKQPFMGFKRD